MPFFLLPPEQNRGRGSGAPAVADSGVPGHGGGRGVGGNGEEEEGVRFPCLARAGAKRGGGATRASRRRAAAFVAAALWDAAAARAGGRSTRGSRGVDSLTYSELGQREFFKTKWCSSLSSEFFRPISRSLKDLTPTPESITLFALDPCTHPTAHA